MKTCIALLASMLCVATPTLADDDSPSINIDLHSRVSYLNNRIGNEINHANSGYKGEYFLLSVSGQINDKISYAWRQRLNKKIDNNSMFDATDWLYVDYKFAPNWSVAAGKQDMSMTATLSTSTFHQNTGTTSLLSSLAQALPTPQMTATTASPDR